MAVGSSASVLLYDARYDHEKGTAAGCAYHIVLPNYVVATVAPQTEPFVALVDTGQTAVTLDASLSISTGGDIISWEWSLGRA